MGHAWRGIRNKNMGDIAYHYKYDNGCDDNRNGVSQGLFLRRFHQGWKSQVKKIQPV
jgi:hypothetical protein